MIIFWHQIYYLILSDRYFFEASHLLFLSLFLSLSHTHTKTSESDLWFSFPSLNVSALLNLTKQFKAHAGFEYQITVKLNFDQISLTPTINLLSFLTFALHILFTLIVTKKLLPKPVHHNMMHQGERFKLKYTCPFRCPQK